MVACSADHGLQADVIFAIEGTAVNGAYINDLKSNYILPSLEYFSQGNVDEINYMSESANCLYGIVVYHAADCLPNPSTDTIGPFSSPAKLLTALDKLELIGGKGESRANVAEGLATALQCFEELQLKRDPATSIQKHCIMICNSSPYLLPVMESHGFAGKTTEQLASVLQERGINLSVISPRKIPSLYKLFEKAGGDLSASQMKNYAKDPRHLVLLKGFSLKERPISPPGGAVTSSQNQLSNSAIPITSLPSPLAGSDSPIPGGAAQTNQNLLVQNPNTGQPNVGQSPIYRPNSSQGMGTPGIGMVNPVRGGMMTNTPFPNQPIQGPPGYHPAGMANRGATRWIIPPQPPQRPQYMPQPGPQQPNQPNQGSALIAQLTQPPSSMPNPVNQFPPLTDMIPVGNNSPLTAAQQQMRIGMMNAAAQQQQQQQQQQQNVQTSMAQNPQTQNMQQHNSNPNQVNPGNQVITSQAPGQNTSNPTRQTIWSGMLEWIEKPKVPTDPQKITKHVPCSVSANSKDGEPELKADGWPPKLIMQLMPKQLIGNIGGAYLKNSKSVLFHPTPCEPLESLTKVMSSGFAGCVHFTSNPNPAACDIKVLILLYTVEKRAYLGFIPNDQAAFVDRLRKVIQQQKSTQMLRQTPQTGAPMGGGMSQMSVSNTSTSQSGPQQGLMMSQTNTMAMGGGQITQNVVTSSGQPGQQNIGGPGLMGQNVPGAATMQQRLRMPGMQQSGNQIPNQGQQQQQQQQQQQPQNPNMMSGGSAIGSGAQRPNQQPYANQLEVDRQANLDKINQLKQTLEVAQQQEQQYKNQLERISHMKTAQLQEALHLAQQQEVQYKMLDQQRLANQGNPQAANQQGQRMLRPISNNPGLRTLLQQQPYKPAIMNMHQMGAAQNRPQMGQQMQGNAGNQQVNFDDVTNFDFI